MKLERVIEYDAKAMDSLSLVLAVAKEYREADAAMKPVLLKALQNFIHPPLIARELPDEPKAAQAVVDRGGSGFAETPMTMTTVTEPMPPIPASLKR